MEDDQLKNVLGVLTGILVLLGVGALAAYWLLPVNHVSSYSSCVNNLRYLQSASDQWAIEEAKSIGDPVTFADVAPFIRGPLICPDGGVYTLADVGGDPTSTCGARLP